MECEFNGSQLQRKPRNSAKGVGFRGVGGIDVRRLSELHACCLAKQDCREPLIAEAVGKGEGA